MTQYTTGTVNVVNGNNVITGVGTQWQTDPVDPIQVNDLIGVKVTGEEVLYTISAVDSDTQLQISVPYGGTTGNGLNYAITRNFTPGGLPLMNIGDAFIPQIYNRGLVALENLVSTTPFTLPVVDTQALVQDDVDATKLVRIDAGDTPPATTGALFMPSVDVDFRAPARPVRRLMQEPIEGNSLVGSVTFDGDPDSPTCMLGEVLQCDNSGVDFDMFFDPAQIITPDNWQGLLCWLRPISGNNLASISVAGSVPGPGFDLSWQNGYPDANQSLLTIYLGYEQSQANGYIIPVFKRSDKIITWGAVRPFAGNDLQLRFGIEDADAQGGKIANYAGRIDQRGNTYTFLQQDAGKLRGFSGDTPATWTVPDLALPNNGYISVEVINFGTSTITFVPSGVNFIQPLTVLPGNASSCVVQWLGDPRSTGTNQVKITGELT